MIKRLISRKLKLALADTPVVMIKGPRQSGKSTLAASLEGFSFSSLDLARERAAARRDPDGYIAALDRPAVIDEVQLVPELLPAIKYAVDSDRRPGQFVLTGSADVLLLPKVSESLAGRIEIQTLWPFSVSELEGAVPENTFLDLAFDPEAELTGPSLAAPELSEVLLRGGFPEIVTRPKSRRGAWFDSYISTMIDRDLTTLSEIERIDRIYDILLLLAERTQSPLNVSTLASLADMSEPTARRYLTLLERIFFMVRTAPYMRSVGRRVTKAPRIQLCDVGLLAHLLQIDVRRLSGHALGTLLEAFVGDELRKQMTWAEVWLSLHYFRTPNGVEVDYVVATRDGRAVAIEVKSAQSVSAGDFRHIEKLRDDLGEKFVRGIVLYTGDSYLPFGDRLWAVPLTALWSAKRTTETRGAGR